MGFSRHDDGDQAAVDILGGEAVEGGGEES